MPVQLPGRISFVRITSCAGRINFGEGTAAGVFMEVRYIIWLLAYNMEPEYIEKEDRLNLLRLHS
jgi:hypothetical protein